MNTADKVLLIVLIVNLMFTGLALFRISELDSRTRLVGKCTRDLNERLSRLEGRESSSLGGGLATVMGQNVAQAAERREQ